MKKFHWITSPDGRTDQEARVFTADQGVRFFSVLLLFLHILILCFQLISSWSSFHGLMPLVEVFTIALIGFLLLSHDRFTLQQRVVVLTVAMLIPAALELFSTGLLSIGKTMIWMAPVLVAFAFNRPPVTVSVLISCLIFLIAGFGSSFGMISPGGSGAASHPVFLGMDVITMAVFSLAFLLIIHQFKQRLIGYFTDISKRNNDLQEGERALMAIRAELKVKVDTRIAELDQARELLLRSKERLNEQNSHMLSQRASLEQTYANIQESQANLVQVRKMASLGSLSLGIAHEINNPLNFIHGALLVLEKKLEFRDNDQLVKVLPIMQNAVGRINNIVKSLDQFGPKEKHLPESCDLPSIINNCQILLKPQLPENSRIEITTPEFFPGAVGIPDRLHQVFLNLLHNAIQAITVNGSIAVSFFNDPGERTVGVRIKDNGSGIPEALMEKITQPFFTTKPSGQGTGLGLYISKQIITEHDGRLTFTSSPGRGTTVEVELPEFRTDLPV